MSKSNPEPEQPELRLTKRGYPLFTDVEDVSLRDRNRGNIMAQIVIKEGSMYSEALLDYFSEVPYEERLPATEHFIDFLRKEYKP